MPMTDWWMVAYERRMIERKLLMSVLRITVYGSFYPPEQKNKLLEICSYLKEQGFTDIDIVGGDRRPNPGDLDTFDLSIFYLEESDANFLVFTHEGARLGVTTECDQILNCEPMCRKWSTCVIFNEVHDDIESIGKLQKDRLIQLNENRMRVQVVPFETWDELKEAAYFHAADIFKALGPILRSRVSI